MLVGVPREIKDNEFRVGMTPAAIAELVHHGHGAIRANRTPAAAQASAGDRCTPRMWQRRAHLTFPNWAGVS